MIGSAISWIVKRHQENRAITLTLQITLRENVMKSFISRTVAAAVTAFALSGAAQAADSVNVAFFLEWATPNQIAKVDKAYDEAMGVDVNWTDFSTGVAMTEAMLTTNSHTLHAKTKL